ncbi:MAG: GtrA family protein [Ruminococcaceae bacterium]|nr:GtrA family protein [Oscillospiraceae bacterium]
MWKFLLVGILNTVVGNGLMFLLYNLFHIGYWPSTAISYALASVMSYFLNRYFTFKYQGSGYGVVLRFALNIIVCYALAYGIAQPLVSWILSAASVTVRDNVAMLAGMCLFVGFNYIGQRFFAFREEK